MSVGGCLLITSYRVTGPMEQSADCCATSLVGQAADSFTPNYLHFVTQLQATRKKKEKKGGKEQKINVPQEGEMWKRNML